MGGDVPGRGFKRYNNVSYEVCAQKCNEFAKCTGMEWFYRKNWYNKGTCFPMINMQQNQDILDNIPVIDMAHHVLVKIGMIDYQLMYGMTTALAQKDIPSCVLSLETLQIT